MNRLANPETFDRFSNNEVKLAQTIIEDYAESPIINRRYTNADLDKLQDIGKSTLATICYLEMAQRSHDSSYISAKWWGDEPTRQRIRELQTNVSPLVSDRLDSGRIF